MLGIGPFPTDDEVDADLINAGKQTITEIAGAKRVLVLMTHASKHGEPKLLESCSLPLTGKAVVHQIMTDLAVIDVEPGRGFVLREIAPGWTVEELQEVTGAKLHTDGPVPEIEIS